MDKLLAVTFLMALAGLIISLVVAFKRPKHTDGEYLTVKQGDLILIEEDKVLIHRFGAIAVEQELRPGEEGNEDLNTIIFKAGRQTKKIKLH